MSKVLVAFLSLLIALSASTQQTPSSDKPVTGCYSVPIEAAKKANPVTPSAESLARGKHQYGFDCAMCHGKEGDGQGDVSADLKLKMHDYTNPATLKDRTDANCSTSSKMARIRCRPRATA